MTRVADNSGSSAWLRFWREFAAWGPVWVPLVLVAQLGIRGLRPALAEDLRLERAERGLETRHDAAQRERTALERRLRAQQDPIYQERELRAWQRAASPASPASPPSPPSPAGGAAQDRDGQAAPLGAAHGGEPGPADRGAEGDRGEGGDGNRR